MNPVTFDQPPFGLTQVDKAPQLVEMLAALTDHHRGRCAAYRKILEAFYREPAPLDCLEAIPWIPVGLFKSHRLVSVPDTEVVRTLTSSGTTGQAVSRIELDANTANRQTRALTHIMAQVLGPRRLPMILIDSRAVLENRGSFSARTAGVLGMMNLGRAHFWALDTEMELDRAGLESFLAQYGGEPFVMFGFTFMAWQYFLQRLDKGRYDLSNGILIHGGGWKKLQEQAVSSSAFKDEFRTQANLQRIHNFYGMVEQVGSVFVEGTDGFLHAPSYADVIVRNPGSWTPCPVGEPGVLQVVSALPESYPGHSLMTEDWGVIRSVDDPDCSWGDKAFEVLGRVPKAELRGCSDIHAYGDAT